MKTKNNQIRKNVLLTSIYFFVNTGINFYLSSYVINNIGISANGFISLANSFVDYASLVTVALNSVAGRFISIYASKGEYEKAKKYFNSAVGADLVIGLLTLGIGILGVINLEKIIEIPIEMIWDVKILFCLVFINFFLSIMISVFSVSTFIVNRMDLAALRRTEGVILKAVLLIGLFSVFSPKLYFVSVVSISYSIYYLIFNVFYLKRYCPDLKIEIRFFSLKHFLEMISSGIWNTITQLGFILTSGLDLLICNKWLGAVAMGQMSFPKQLYNIITGFISTLVTAYQPTFVRLYAEGNIDKLKTRLTEAMGVSGILSSIIITDVVVYGKDFLKLYIPGQDIQLIWILMILSIQVLFVSGTQYPLYYIYTLTNKLKVNSIVEIFSGIINVGIVFILLRNTELGIYAVAGVSTLVGIIKNLFFTPMYSAYCLKISKKTFYPQIIRYIVALGLTLFVNWRISKLFVIQSWMSLMIVGCISIVIGGLIGFIIQLNASYRHAIQKKLLERI